LSSELKLSEKSVRLLFTNPAKPGINFIVNQILTLFQIRSNQQL